MSWQRVRGHDALVQAFERAYRSGRLAHAYLFLGPAGVGKRLFAQELAKALLCEARPDGRLEACGHCPACKQVDAGARPDFFATGRPEESPSIPIDTVRELSRNLSLKAVRGRGKVAILDDADDFNDPITSHAAANAFLKTLEEPPPGSLLILIATSPDQQLPTIRSRCQEVRFAPLPDAVVDDLLQSQGVADPALRARLVRLSGGSPGHAHALADPALWEFRRTLLQGLSRPQPDSVALGRAWMQFVEEAGKESAAHRRRAALALGLLVQFLKDALRLSLGETQPTADPDDLRALEAIGKRLGPEQLLDVLDRCLEADVQIDRRVQLVLILEALADTLGQKMKGPPVV